MTSLLAELRFHTDGAALQVRKHMKVDSRRWYHHANTLGLLVWQE